MSGPAHGARIRLRPLADGDEALYVALYSDPETMRHVGAAQSVDVARRGFAAARRAQAGAVPRRPLWVIERDGDGVALGLIGLVPDADGNAEVGVVLPAAHQGRGNATGAIAALATHAFATLGIARLHTRHAADHERAAGLMRGLGFVRVAAVADDPHPARWELRASDWRPRQ